MTRPSRGSPYPIVAPWVGLGAPAVLPTMEPEVLVEPVTGASVDNFWHNDFLPAFVAHAVVVNGATWLNHIHSDGQPINIIIECLVLDLYISRALRTLSLLDGL